MKAFLGSLIGIIVAAIIAAVVIAFIFWSRVPDILANNLSNKLKVSVTIDDISLSWGEIKISDVEIANPRKSILPKAFACQEINVFAPFTHYLDDNVEIDQIDLNDVYLGLEFDTATSTQGNWTEIMSNLKTTSEKEASKNKGEKRTVLIRRLVLTNINVDVVYRKDGGKVQKLKRIDRMELTNISSEGGLPLDQVMNSVLGQMLKSVFEKENLKNMLQDLLNQKGPWQKYVEPFKGLFNARPIENTVYTSEIIETVS
ncbi:MAG TPA: AsmA family protein [Rhabdochlamydiaceae bacterium]|nr:AsmA family protein [Rhabdochlamydiaceae bacterium]